VTKWQARASHGFVIPLSLRQFEIIGVLKGASRRPRIVVAHLGVVFLGFSGIGVAGCVMLIGSDPAMLSSKPCSSFCSFEVLERFRLLLEGTWGSAPRFFVAG